MSYGEKGLVMPDTTEEKARRQKLFEEIQELWEEIENKTEEDVNPNEHPEIGCDN